MTFQILCNQYDHFFRIFLWDNSLKVSFQKNYEVFVTLWCLTPLQSLLADPGKDRGCSTITSVIHSFIHSVIHWWFGKISLRRRHALMVGDGHKIDYVNIFRRFQILKGLHIALLVQKLPRFCLMGGFWLLVELQRWRVCVCSLRRPIIYHTIYWKLSGVPPTRSINFFTKKCFL